MERARRAGRSLRPSYLPVALGGAEVSAQSPDIAVHPLVIIGSGFASFCLVAHLLETHAVKATDITIIGPHPFGHGAGPVRFLPACQQKGQWKIRGLESG